MSASVSSDSIALYKFCIIQNITIIIIIIRRTERCWLSLCPPIALLVLTVAVRDVRILEFWVRFHVRRIASLSALSATVIMFKIYWNPGTAFNNAACAKKTANATEIL